MCGQPTAYNAYATLPYTNPLFMGFSRSQNVNKEIVFTISKRLPKPLQTQCLQGFFLCLRLGKKLLKSGRFLTVAHKFS